MCLASQIKEKLLQLTDKRKDMIDKWEDRWEWLRLSKCSVSMTTHLRSLLKHRWVVVRCFVVLLIACCKLMTETLKRAEKRPWCTGNDVAGNDSDLFMSDFLTGSLKKDVGSCNLCLTLTSLSPCVCV